MALALLAGCGDDDAPGEPDAGFDPWVLDQLAADEGFSVRTPEFDVPAGTEVQDCYFVDVPDIADGADLWINRIVTGINPGSHHMNVFRVRTIGSLDPAAGEPVEMGPGLNGTVVRGGACWNSAAWADWPLIANSQKASVDDPLTDWTMPDGVAMRFVPGETIMLQAHYVNATTQTTPFRGRVGINFHRSPDADPMEMGTLFATQQSIRICESNPTPTYSGTCSFPAGQVTISAANGHFHSRGERFRIYAWDGMSDTRPADEELFYESVSWDDPPMETGLALQPPEDGGIWWTCEYRWRYPEIGCDAVNEADAQQANDCCYTFGGWVETNEHCNVFLYYYPRVADTDVFCN